MPTCDIVPGAPLPPGCALDTRGAIPLQEGSGRARQTRTLTPQRIGVDVNPYPLGIRKGTSNDRTMSDIKGMDPPQLSDPAVQAAYDRAVRNHGTALTSLLTDSEKRAITIRKARIDATRNGEDPSKVGPEDADPAQAGEAIFAYHGKDGRHAVARVFTPIVRSDETAATRYAGHSSVNGAIPRTKPGVKGTLARKQLAARLAEETFAATADACKRFEALRAQCIPGGRIWLTCKSRVQKRTLAQCVREATKVARNGAYSHAIEILIKG